LLDRGKCFQTALARETVGKQLLEGQGRRDAGALVVQQVFERDFAGQQVFEGGLVRIHRNCFIGRTAGL